MRYLSEQSSFYVLVLFRIAGVMTTAPMLGSASIPVRIRVFIALILSLAVFPLVPRTVVVPNSLAGMAVGVAGELIIGITMGFALSLMFVGIQIGAEMVSYQMGLSLSNLIDPSSEVATTVLSQFYLLLATLLYILMNGHLILIKSLAHTFSTVPLMGGFGSGNIINAIIQFYTSILSGSFMLGISFAGPALIAIFLASLAMGFISRTMPQLNILVVGFAVRIILALILLIASLGMICAIFQDTIVDVLRQIGMVFV